MAAPTPIARLEAFRRDGEINGSRRDAFAAQRVDHGKEPLAIGILAGTYDVVELALIPKDMRDGVAVRLDLAERVNQDRVEISAPRPSLDGRSRIGHGRDDHGVELARLDQVIAELSPIFPLGSTGTEQRRGGDIALPVEEVDDLVAVLRGKALTAIICGVGLPEDQQHGGAIRLPGAGDRRLLGIADDAILGIEGVTAFRLHFGGKYFFPHGDQLRHGKYAMSIALGAK